MSRPGPLPTAPDHELHDPLLVAQHAAGDQLDPDQQRLAEQMVSTCGACAALAGDLRAVSGAVAWEPVLPRRRDFRISPEQADELHGNPFTRFMRRLALPRARAFGPVAAGVMSIGLVFVIAGTAWPSAEIQSMSVEPVSAPVPVIGEPETPLAGLEDLGEPAVEAEAMFSDAIEQADPDLPLDDIAEQSDLTGGAAAPDGAVEDNARRALGAASSSQRVEEAEGALLGDVSEAPNVGTDAAERRAQTEVQSDSAAELAPDPALDEGVSKALDVTTIAGTDDDSTELDQAASFGTDDGIDIETLLLALGAALAIGGAALLLLAWLARRSADPLLP